MKMNIFWHFIAIYDFRYTKTHLHTVVFKQSTTINEAGILHSKEKTLSVSNVDSQSSSTIEQMQRK